MSGVPVGDFTEVSAELGPEDLARFVQLAESQIQAESGPKTEYVAGPSSWTRGHEGGRARSSQDLEALYESLSSLRSEVSRLVDEVQSLKVSLVSLHASLPRNEARRLLESSSWDVSLALSRVDGPAGKVPKARPRRERHVEVPSSVPVEESSDGSSGEV